MNQATKCLLGQSKFLITNVKSRSLAIAGVIYMYSGDYALSVLLIRDTPNGPRLKEVSMSPGIKITFSIYNMRCMQSGYPPSESVSIEWFNCNHISVSGVVIKLT